MPTDSSGQDLDDPDIEFVEVDPSGRYGRVSFTSSSMPILHAFRYTPSFTSLFNLILLIID